MTAGRELDALVAEKVMGWRCVGTGLSNRLMGKTAQGGFGVQGTLQDVPGYSTDIAAAYLVINKLWKENHRINLRWFVDGFFVKIEPINEPFQAVQAFVETFEGDMPLAICRAALGLKGTWL